MNDFYIPCFVSQSRHATDVYLRIQAGIREHEKCLSILVMKILISPGTTETKGKLRGPPIALTA